MIVLFVGFLSFSLEEFGFSKTFLLFSLFCEFETWVMTGLFGVFFIYLIQNFTTPIFQGSTIVKFLFQSATNFIIF